MTDASSMFIKSSIVKIFLILFMLTLFIGLSYEFVNSSYNLFLVTPLFFLQFAKHLFPLTIFVGCLVIFILTVMNDKALLTFSSLILYFVVLFIPYSIFHFPIYNDQLGFSLEILNGMKDGVVLPYQGDYSTLGHAFFTSILAEILGLNLFQAVQFSEGFFVFVAFSVYISFAIWLLKRHKGQHMSSLVVTALLAFPAFIPDALIYSRGYFGLVISTVLLFSIFSLLEKSDLRSSVVIVVIFITSSLSYPLYSLMVAIGMLLMQFLMFLRPSRDEQRGKGFLPLTLTLFAIWLCVQAYLGYATWRSSSQITLQVLEQEFFAGLESTIAFRYTGDALVYTYLRTLMMIAGWLIAAFVAIIFTLEILKGRLLRKEYFALSVLMSFGIVGIIFLIAYHDLGERAYRGLVSILPFALVCLANRPFSRDFLRRFKSMVPASLLLLTLFSITSSPITKWGWTFVAYPTQRDIALSNFIVSFQGAPIRGIYAPGSHELLWFSFQSVGMQNDISMPVIYSADDLTFNVDEASSAGYTATYYRIFVLSHWLGKSSDVIKTLNILEPNVDKLYDAGAFRMLIKTITS